MAVETFHHPKLHHFVPLNPTRLKLRNLGVYSHKCCHGDMPWCCWIVLRVSSNVVWTLYEVFEELGWQWRHFMRVLPSFCLILLCLLLLLTAKVTLIIRILHIFIPITSNFSIISPSTLLFLLSSSSTINSSLSSSSK